MPMTMIATAIEPAASVWAREERGCDVWVDIMPAAWKLAGELADGSTPERRGPSSLDIANSKRRTHCACSSLPIRWWSPHVLCSGTGLIVAFVLWDDERSHDPGAHARFAAGTDCAKYTGMLSMRSGRPQLGHGGGRPSRMAVARPARLRSNRTVIHQEAARAAPLRRANRVG